MSNNFIGARKALSVQPCDHSVWFAQRAPGAAWFGRGRWHRGRLRGCQRRSLYEIAGEKPVKPATGNTTKPKTGTKPTAPDNSAQMDDAMSLADDARQAGRNEAAERGYLLASKLMPSDPRPYLGLGHIYYNQKKYPDAEKFYARAASLARGDSEPYARLAFTYSEMERFDEAADRRAPGRRRANRKIITAIWLWVTSSICARATPRQKPLIAKQ